MGQWGWVGATIRNGERNSTLTHANPGRIEAVVLDWAGTVVDFGSCAPVRAFVAAFADLGVEITDAHAREPMGRAKIDHIRDILAIPEVSQRWQEKFGSPPGESEVQALYDRFLPLQKQVILQHAELIPGARTAVADLRRRGIKIGSTTGYTRELMEALMPVAKTAGYDPDVLVCPSDISEGRPAPWWIQENARQLGVKTMSAIVKVDDTVTGIVAGRNAGVWTIGISKTGNLVGLDQRSFEALASWRKEDLVTVAARALREAGSHLVIESVETLPAAIQIIESWLAAGERP